MTDDFGLTESENLWNKVSIPRLIQIIKIPINEVIGDDKSTNNYGEFLFITIRNKSTKDTIFFYTFGYHELLNKYLTNIAKTGVGNYDKKSKPLNKNTVIKKIISERKKAIKDSKKYAKEKSSIKITDMSMEELEEVVFI